MVDENGEFLVKGEGEEVWRRGGRGVRNGENYWFKRISGEDKGDGMGGRGGGGGGGGE